MREVALIRSCANRLVDNLRNNRLDEAEQIDRWRASYRELNDSFLNSFIPCCSKLAKLDWFVRLRANMAKNLSASI